MLDKFYPKIQNLFKLNPETKQRTTEYTNKYFDMLRNIEWVFTEKVDGMNMRVIFDEEGRMSIKGRTNKAELLPDLVNTIAEMFKDVHVENTIFFGEGYGGKIQKGHKYNETPTFVCFDVLSGCTFLPPKPAREMCNSLEIPFVHQFPYMNTLGDAYCAVQRGLFSHYGAFLAEGVVGVPAVPLYDSYGGRIQVKIKTRDFYQKELEAV